MSIKTSDLRSASNRSGRVVLTKSIHEARAKNQQTAFLCHSHKDHELAKGLQVLMKEHGWNLYIDWEDSGMPSTPNKETANIIKTKIKTTDWFLFLATGNSTQSRWCPWEIGFADSSQDYEKILIIPTEDDYGNWYGNEYLQLYKKMDNGSNKLTGKSGYAVFDAGTNSGTWIENL
ncbi:toll/interleukin-1 receptor domain-containing protein [Neptunomonas sp.]|uniref:toll/interleukin-1 receptor domain-containing protein n=1 Tax=Neptunomonas sp. TaxID=1971898 RepID=UPI00356798E8